MRRISLSLARRRRRRLTFAAALALIFIASLHFPAAAKRDEGAEFFEKKIRPIFATRCLSCHNAEAKIAGLDLSSAEGFARGGESGLLVDPSRPAESRLLKAIGYQEKLKMPPAGKLAADEIAAIAEWVGMGAPWAGLKASKADAPKASVAAGNPKPALRAFTDEEKNFWAFQPVSDPAPPAVKNVAWARTPIDRFILARLEAKGLRPAPPADKLTLLRRATYDLTGLPPTPDEIRDFLADRSKEAFKRVVERLLASPRYGEQWGRHWLDVARYADSTGNDEDHRYPHAWRYRDYVIDAFNRDLPYDQFVREQIAGDLLDSDDPSGLNRRGIIATGFLALGPKALAQQDKTKMLYDVYDEQVDVTSKAFLGLTVSCARCHDHKFDPLLARDYYALISIFASTRSFRDPKEFVSPPLTRPLVPPAEYDRYLALRRTHEDRLKRNRYATDEIIDGVREPEARAASARLADYLLGARRIYQDGIEAAQAARETGLEAGALARWADYLKPGAKVRHHLLAWHEAAPEQLRETARRYQERFASRLTDWLARMKDYRARYAAAVMAGKSPLPSRPSFEGSEDRFFAEVYFGKEGPLAVAETDEERFAPPARAFLASLRAEREALKAAAPAEPAMACAVAEGELVRQHIFIRGDHHNPGDEVGKGFPLILAAAKEAPAIGAGSGRLELASWLTRAEHPLTSRVIVNRIWGWHFGEGLVRTPDNFGLMGDRPSHPELLDHLARRFVQSGYSIKALHRSIMNSSAYQMASRAPVVGADPENRLLSRFNRRRLAIEEIRDGLLSLSGAIDLTMGGTLQSGTGTDGENDNKRLSLNPEKVKRRTVYLPLRRANLPALLNLFDFGDATTVTGRRQLTNVATQALFWLNSEFLTERSRELAALALAAPELTPAERLARVYLRILNRDPERDEIARDLSYIAELERQSPAREAWASLCRVLMASNDFIYLD